MKIKLSKEISQKYTLDEAKQFFGLTAKDNPLDKIDAIVGDDKQPSTFYPQVKIQRWDNL